MTPEPPTDAPASPSLGVRLALVVLPLVLLTGLAELVLWGLGLGGPRSLPPTGRGFDPEAAYLAELPDGGWITQLHGDAEFEVRIPPRDGRRRVLLFGGSNTQLFPEAYLEELLHATEPGGRGWEVINLGRNGYGSARVVILLEQALRQLEPDVVCVYSGHNEFVEAGFRFEIEEALGEPADAGAGWLTELRLYRVVEALARPAASPPTDIDPAETAYSDLTWDGTLKVYAAYAENLRRMARACEAADVPVVFGTVIGNDWNVPWVSQILDAGGPDATERLRRKTTRTLAAISELVPERFRLWEAGQSPPRLHVGRWYDKGGTPWDPGPIPAHLGPLAEPRGWDGGDPRQDSAPGAFWPDPLGWHISVRDIVQRAHAHLRPVELTRDERAGLQLASEGLDVLLTVHPHHARALFMTGQVRWLLGDREGGAALLRKAAALDCAPRRGNFTTNTYVRDVAAEFPGATLFDVAANFRKWSPHGLVGYALMMDGCHLQPGARRVLLAQLAPRLRDAAGD